MTKESKMVSVNDSNQLCLDKLILCLLHLVVSHLFLILPFAKLQAYFQKVKVQSILNKRQSKRFIVLSLQLLPQECLVLKIYLQFPMLHEEENFLGKSFLMLVFTYKARSKI